MDNAKLAELQNINNHGKENGSSDMWDKEEIHNKSVLLRQAVMCFGTFMMTLGAGSTAGFSAILIPQLKKESNNNLSLEMESWVAAISSLPMLFGNLLAGYLMERFGRRTSQVILAFFFTSGWAVIGFAPNIYIILAGRFITGFCQGWLGPLGPVYVGEISTPSHRGFYLAGLSLAIAGGVFFSHLFGTLLHWKHAALLCGLFPFTGGVILYFAPETPVWLAMKNRIEECVSSFSWYRGTNRKAKSELDMMLVEMEKRDQTQSKLRTLRTNIKKPEFYKPLIIMMVFFIMTQLSGVNVINAFTTELMTGLIGSDSYAHIAMLCIDVLRCVSLAMACVLLRRNGRRPMAIFSGVFTSLSLISLSIYMFAMDIRKSSPFVTISLMAVYMIVSNLGVVPLPWNMVGELFASETKGLGSAISVMTTSIAYFATIKSATWMFHSIGYNGTYMFYGLSTLLGTVYLFFYLPETKGKTLLQIEENFRYGKKLERKHTDKGEA